MTVVDQVFQLATDVNGLRNAIANGKVASMLGVEGCVRYNCKIISTRMPIF